MKFQGSDVKVMFLVVGSFIMLAPLVFIAPKVVPFLISAGLFFFGGKQLISIYSLKSWVGVDAELIQSDIGVYGVAISQYSPPIPHYYPLVHFSYIVAGKSYTSNTFNIDRRNVWNSDKTIADKLLSDLRADGLLAYVNPNNPNEAVLSKQVNPKQVSHAAALIVSSILVALLGVWLMFSV